MSSSIVLIVDDEEDARTACARMLKRRHVENILESATGAQAIEFLKKEKVAIAFLDIQLADSINGMEVLKQGLEISPSTKYVMMSAHKEEYEAEATKLGAYAFLSKPISKIDDFLTLIEKVGKEQSLA